jgi:hypothetical protein
MFNNRESDNQFQPDTQIRYGHTQATGGSDFTEPPEYVQEEPPEYIQEEPPEYIQEEMRESTPEELQAKTKRAVLEMLTVLLECTHLPPDWFSTCRI